ncbi:MAG: hypothetical protein JWM65_1213 [Sphingomonas bacterium]|nr:hypothetical protein [Sphingomonas bacterium]
MGKDRDYYLKRAREERAKAETSVDGGARIVHGKMADLYAERASDGTGGRDGTRATGNRLFVVRE